MLEEDIPPEPEPEPEIGISIREIHRMFLTGIKTIFYLLADV